MKNIRVLWGALFVALTVSIFAFAMQSMPTSNAAQAPASQKSGVTSAPATNVAATAEKSDCGDCGDKEACPEKEKGACPLEAAAKAEHKQMAEVKADGDTCCAAK